MLYTAPPPTHPLKYATYNQQRCLVEGGDSCMSAGTKLHTSPPHSQKLPLFTNSSLIHKLLPHSQITPSFTKFTAMIFCFPLFKFINLGLPHFGQIWDCSDVETGAVRTRTTPRLPRHLAYSPFLNLCDKQPDKSKSLIRP